MIDKDAAKELMANAKCYLQCIPAVYVWYAIAAALDKIANGEPVSSDTQELISDARCLEQCIPAGYLPYVILSVITQITGGGGGGTCVVCHDADPVDGVDAPPCDCSLWIAKRGDVRNLWVSSDGATWNIVGTYWP